MQRIIISALLGCSLASAGFAQSPLFGATFSGCREVANVGILPTANARPLVPPQFTLAGDATSTPFVVRTVHCDAISIANKEGKAGPAKGPADILQIGIVIVGPDNDGSNINNYTVYYDTSDAELAGHLQDAGVPARPVHALQESFTPNPDGSGQYSFVVPAPFQPQLTFAGPVGAPSAPFPFIANWWFSSPAGTVKMNSSFPGLVYGGDSVILTVPPATPLASLLGTTTVGSWPALALFDTFPAASMQVTVR
jgi:hypothetical protein